MLKFAPRVLLLAAFFSFLSPSSSTLHAGAFTEPFFVTVERVELKDTAGVWVKIIEPDRRFDLLSEEPVVQFFNNTGRIPAGTYTNVRVTARMDEDPRAVVFGRKLDYETPLAIARGAFVRVRFLFDLESGSRTLDERSVREVHVSIDEDERQEPGSSFTFTHQD